MSRRCITLHLGEPKCFVNEMCTACFASVVHLLCEFGPKVLQAVKIETWFADNPEYVPDYEQDRRKEIVISK